MPTEEQWHQFEALRDDGAPARFRIRNMDPRTDQPKIFVIELPYPITDLSRLPDAASYRRIATFEEHWLIPAAGTLGWTFVAAKIDDGSCFLYLYGASDPTPMIERLAPFDGALGFFDESDPEWDEYAALKELLDEANALPAPEPSIEAAAALTTMPVRSSRPAAPTIPITTTKPKPKPKPKPKAKAKAKPAATAKAKPKTKPAAKAKRNKAATNKRPAANKPAAKKLAANKPARTKRR